MRLIIIVSTLLFSLFFLSSASAVALEKQSLADQSCLVDCHSNLLDCMDNPPKGTCNSSMKKITCMKNILPVCQGVFNHCSKKCGGSKKN